MKTRRWSEFRARVFTPAELKEIDKAVKTKVMEMDLRALRKALGKTQEEVAEVLRKAQSEVSRLERQDDWYLSTLQRYVRALGGELEVTANFGKQRVRLRAA
jgi:predicted transcriptional regulator